jgi:hypothetical protein
MSFFKKKKDKDKVQIGAPIVGTFAHTAHAQLDPSSPTGIAVSCLTISLL